MQPEKCVMFPRSDTAVGITSWLRRRRIDAAPRRIAAGCLATFVSMTFALAADKAPVMTTPGALSVNATGGADYSIPIAVPPGTAGLPPSPALTQFRPKIEWILRLGLEPDQGT